MLVLAALVMVNLYVFVWDKQTSVGAIKRAADRATPTAMVPSHPLAERGAGSGSTAPPTAPSGGIEHGETGAGGPGSDGAARGSVPRGIAHGEAGGGASDDSSGGPGGSGPRGIHGKVGRSDTLGRVLKRSGLSAAETDEVIRALSGVFDFKTMRAGQTFRIERGPDGRVKAFELAVGKTQNVRAERNADGALVGSAAGAQPRSETDPRP